MEQPLISPLAYVDPTAKLGENVRIEAFAFIGPNVIIGSNTTIFHHVTILEGVSIGTDNTIYQNTVLGAVPQSFKYHGEHSYVKIGNSNVIRENVIIAGSNTKNSTTTIGSNNCIMEAVHICHDTYIGNNCVIGTQSQISGACQIEDYSIISNAVILQRRVRVGRYALLQSGTITQKDIPPYIIVCGNPTCYHGVNLHILTKYLNLSERIIRHITNTYHLIYKTNTSLQDAGIRIRQQIPHSEEIEHIIEFIKDSKLGIVGKE